MRRVTTWLAAAAPPGLLLLASCAAPAPGPVFPTVTPRLVWPAPPDAPRIEYVGALEGQRSLGVAPTGWDAVRLALAGEEPHYARFVTPLAVAVDGDLVYVADPAAAGGPSVHVLDLAGRSYRAIRAAAGEPLAWPIDVVAADGRVGIVDARRAAVFFFGPGGRETGAVGAGLLQRPASAAWNAAARELWVVDAAAHACFVFAEDGTLLRRVGRRGNAAGEFNYPAGVALLPAGPTGAPAVLVADAMNFRVVRLATDGEPLGAFGQKGDAAGCFSLPRDVAFDSEGHAYVLDNQFENVQVFDADGRLLMAWGHEGRGPGQFSLPSGITIDAQDRIWIADTYNRRVQVFRYQGSGRARPLDA